MRGVKEVYAGVVVIGGGMAGFSSVLSLHGKRDCLLIRDGGGATSLSSGSVKVAGGASSLKRESFVEILEEIRRQDPDFPSHILTSSGDIAGEIDLVLSDLGKGGACYRGEPPLNSLALTFRGEVLNAAFHPVLSFPLSPLLNGKRVCLFFPSSFPSHFGEYIKGKVTSLFSLLKIESTLLRVSPFHIPPTNSIHPRDAARALSTIIPDDCDIAGFVTTGDLFGLSFPGISRALAAMKDGDLEVYELPGAIPSAPGLRLSSAIEKRLSDMGIKTVHGRAVSSTCMGGKIRSLLVRERGGEGGGIRVFGETFILATGRFIPRGLEKGRESREAIFHLPVRSSPLSLYYAGFRGEPSPSIYDGHPFFLTGLEVNERGEPVDESGTPFFENLLSSGSIIAGASLLKHGTGLGLAILSGKRAGEMAKGT